MLDLMCLALTIGLLIVFLVIIPIVVVYRQLHSVKKVKFNDPELEAAIKAFFDNLAKANKE